MTANSPFIAPSAELPPAQRSPAGERRQETAHLWHGGHFSAGAMAAWEAWRIQRSSAGCVTIGSSEKTTSLSRSGSESATCCFGARQRSQPGSTPRWQPPSVTLACGSASTSSATSVFLISARYSAPISGRTASIRKWTRYFGPSSLRGGVLRRRIDWIFSMSVSSPTRVSVSLLPAWFSPSSAKR